MSRRGKGSELGDSLRRLVGRLDRKNPGAYLQSRVAQAWAEVAGPSVSSHTTGAHVRQGEMVVYVDSPIWATELSALAEEYRLRVNEHLGQEPVRSVRFTVSRKVAEQRRIETADRALEGQDGSEKTPSIPLTPEERAQVEASVANIGDEALREAVLRATIADMEWKKGESGRRAR